MAIPDVTRRRRSAPAPDQNCVNPPSTTSQPGKTLSRRARCCRNGRSVPIDVNDGLGEVARGFLGQIVTDAAFDQSMRVLA